MARIMGHLQRYAKCIIPLVSSAGITAASLAGHIIIDVESAASDANANSEASLNITLTVTDVNDLSGINNLIRSQHQPTWNHPDGVEYTCRAEWTGPDVRSGLFDSPSDWALAFDIAAVPASVAAGLLTNYLWTLIERGRRRSPQSADPGPKPPFHDARSVTIVIITTARRIEIDALRIELHDLESSVSTACDEKGPTSIGTD